MSFDLENIKDSLDNISLDKLLPDLSNFESSVLSLARLAMLLGPLVLLGLGVFYLVAAPKEANYTTGYRTWFGMGSEEAWKFTQRLAGIVWGGLGIVLLLMSIIVSLTFGGKDVMQIATSAFICLIWQAGLAVIGGFAVSFIVFLRYDSLGYKRKDT